MSIENADDRAQFFDTDEFAVAATYNRKRWLNDTTAITVIFDDVWIEDGPGTAGIASRRAMALARETEMPEAAVATVTETLTIDDVEYNIVEVHPDGKGMLMLQLSTA
mgnify:CR=1 FL=1